MVERVLYCEMNEHRKMNMIILENCILYFFLRDEASLQRLMSVYIDRHSGLDLWAGTIKLWLTFRWVSIAVDEIFNPHPGNLIYSKTNPALKKVKYF